MANAETSRTIKNAFTISIIGGGIIDVLFISWALFGNNLFYSSTTSFVSVLFVLSFCIAPIILGCISLSMIASCKNYQKSERVFVILTRVFSITSIVEGSVAITIIGLIVLLFRSLGY